MCHWPRRRATARPSLTTTPLVLEAWPIWPPPRSCSMALSDNSLGRSLSDVFAKTVRREQPKGYLEIDLGLIVPPTANPRTDFDAQALEELAASLRTHGMLQP